MIYLEHTQDQEGFDKLSVNLAAPPWFESASEVFPERGFRRDYLNILREMTRIVIEIRINVKNCLVVDRQGTPDGGCEGVTV